MAEKRMFTKMIIDSDAFLEMPLSTQALYFHLAMRADDDGFLNNAKKIQKIISSSDDDLKLLIAKKFIIPFENGVVVIKHWRMHNYIRSDRYKETVYSDEKKMLSINDNGSYSLQIGCSDDLDILGIPNDNQVRPQDRLGKDRLDKDREREEDPRTFFGVMKNVDLDDAQYKTLIEKYERLSDLIDKISLYLANSTKSYDSHYALIEKIAREDKWPRKKPPDEIEPVTEAIRMPEDIKAKMNFFKEVPK